MLHIGLFVSFIIICFNATKLVKEKFGIWASLIFVFGLLSFIGRSDAGKDDTEQHINQSKTWKFNSPDSLGSSSKQHIVIDLEKTLIVKYSLGIVYGKDKQLQNNVPISAYVSTTGFESGRDWKPIYVIVNRTDDNRKFEYEVKATIKWSLLGLTIYSQPKHWKGIATVR